MRRTVVGVFALVSLSLTAMSAAAECPMEVEASAVYEEGARALADGRFNDAARKFAKADELCPHEVALGEAFRAVEASDNPVFCMELVERAERRDALPAERAKLRATCETKVGKIVVRCPGATCEASIDGQPAKLHEARWVLNGEHVVDLRVDGGPRQPHRVTVRPGDTLVVPVAASQKPTLPTPDPGPEPTPIATESSGIHPAFFSVALGLTVIGGALLIWSGVDTLEQNDAYKATRDTTIRSDGLDAQVRTNVFVGVTAGLAVTTAVLAIFTDWGGGESPSPVTIQMDPTGRAGSAQWSGSF